MDEGTKTNKKIDNNAQGPYIRGVLSTDNMCQEKKEDEDAPSLNIAWRHRYKGSMTSFKNSKDELQQP